MKTKETYGNVMNRSVYNKMRKELLAYCSYCGWNSGCNARHKRRGGGWKRNRKTQYKIKRYMFDCSNM